MGATNIPGPDANVAVCRKARGLSQVALARRAGVSVSLLSKIEDGTGTGTQDWDNRASLHSSWLRNPRAAPEVLLSCTHPAKIT